MRKLLTETLNFGFLGAVKRLQINLISIKKVTAVWSITDHMLCLKMSSSLLRIRDPSGAEGLAPVTFNLVDNVLKTLANLAREELRSLCI